MRVDPEPEQQPERALIEVLAAENDEPVSPPTSHPALLPFEELSLRQLSKRLVGILHGCLKTRTRLRRGHRAGPPLV